MTVIYTKFIILLYFYTVEFQIQIQQCIKVEIQNLAVKMYSTSLLLLWSAVSLFGFKVSWQASKVLGKKCYIVMDFEEITLKQFKQLYLSIHREFHGEQYS